MINHLTGFIKSVYQNYFEIASCLGASGIILLAIVMDYVLGLEACPMCMMTRYLFGMIALISLIGFITKKMFLFNKLLVALSSIAGLAVTGKQIYLQNLSEEEKTKWVLNYTRAMQQEIAELIDSVPWKWWAKYQEFDEQNAKVEIVDLFHFLISLAQVMGMTPDDVYNAYVKKNQVNHNRQESGYKDKDESDSRHI